MRNGQELLEEFKMVRREAQKLEIALEVFRPEQELPEDVRREFLDYLIWRKRPAVQALIRSGDLQRLRELKKMGWLEEQNLENYRELAIQSREPEIWSWLLLSAAGRETEPEGSGKESFKQESESVKRNFLKPEGEEKPAGSSEKAEEPAPSGEKQESGSREEAEQLQLCSRVWSLTVRGLRMKLPGLSEALGTFSFRPDPEVKGIACDGFTLFYSPEHVLKRYGQNPESLQRDLLHVILHNMYLHPVLMRKRSERHWNLACDLTVERILDSWKIRGLERPGADFRSYQLKELKLPRHWNSVETMYQTLLEQYPSMEKLAQLEELNRVDDHCRWVLYREKADEDFKKAAGEGGEGQAGQGDGKAFMDTWERLKKEWNPQMGEEHNRAGNQSGSGSQKTPVKKEKEFDYRSFLEEFMVCQEEVELDLDSIDYLPYWYSRNHYKDIVLIEPLEYREVHKLDEMVIAIDTSGSCSGKIVRRFLQETWSILTESGNFFKKMHVHIIQCDSAIQEHVVVHSREEFQEYMEDVTVKGLGGTDFRPVFELVQKMIDEKELLNLKALLYFTDGDGVYPKDPPSFETAFIFLNRAYEKQKIPEWGIRLNLGLQLEE